MQDELRSCFNLNNKLHENIDRIDFFLKEKVGYLYTAGHIRSEASYKLMLRK